MDLPRFTYHPDPIATGSVVAADTPCVCCGESRGYVYAGPVYAEEEYGHEICPWCIADGSAHERLGVIFSDEEGVGGGGEWDEVGEDIIDEIAQRTPGFNGWQQEQWWTHCGHQAVFAALRVPFYRMPLHRLGLIEPVWVVAHVAEGLLYFEDVEAGFEIGAPGDDGALPARGCNQFELTHILHRLAHAGLSRQR